MSATAPVYQEEPIWLRVEDEQIFGVWTTPLSDPSGVAIVLLTGGAWVPSVNRNRLWVKLARELAAHGHASIRLDYHGVGESTGNLIGYRLVDLQPDLLSCLRWVKEQGHEEVFVLGACFGARLAMSIVPLSDDISGLILLAPPVWDSEGASGNLVVGAKLKGLSKADLLRRLTDKRQRLVLRRVLSGRAQSMWRKARAGRGPSSTVDQKIGPNFLRSMARIVAERLPTVLVYGAEEPMYQDYVEARRGRLGKIMQGTDQLIRMEMLGTPVHRLLPVKVQDEVVREAPRWVMELRDSRRDHDEEAMA